MPPLAPRQRPMRLRATVVSGGSVGRLNSTTGWTANHTPGIQTADISNAPGRHFECARTSSHAEVLVISVASSVRCWGKLWTVTGAVSFICWSTVRIYTLPNDGADQTGPDRRLCSFPALSDILLLAADIPVTSIQRLRGCVRRSDVCCGFHMRHCSWDIHCAVHNWLLVYGFGPTALSVKSHWIISYMEMDDQFRDERLSFMSHLIIQIKCDFSPTIYYNFSPIAL